MSLPYLISAIRLLLNIFFIYVLTGYIYAGKATTVTEIVTEPHSRVLRIAADPNNLPFSNQQLEGFENKIAEILADELDARIEWVWHAQRRGFIRNTLKAGRADVTLGVPAGFEMARATEPYYHSTYVFVVRRDSEKPTSLDDPLLKSARVGVQLIGDDGTNSPPVHALARRGIVNNVRGYTVYGDYSKPNPPAEIVKAVAHGEIDVALVWGPLAGYFAAKSEVPLEVIPITPVLDPPGLPMCYSIAAGVKRGDDRLFEDIASALHNRKHEIDAILAQYHVPQVDAAQVPQFEDDDD